MKMVAVDHVDPRYAGQIADLLVETGLHPWFDDLPRPALEGGSVTTPIYVPAEEADAAKQVLAAYYETAREEMDKRLPPLTRGMGLPLVVSLLAAVAVGVATQNPMHGVMALVVTMVLAVWLTSRWSAAKRDGVREEVR